MLTDDGSVKGEAGPELGPIKPSLVEVGHWSYAHATARNRTARVFSKPRGREVADAQRQVQESDGEPTAA